MAAALYVFDAYGTLFDVHSAVGRHRERVGPQAELISELWRAKQLEYTWVRSLMGAYQDFDALTEQALDYAVARCGGISPEARILLLDAYRRLDAFADAAPTLARLRAKGSHCVILSNGTPAGLACAIASAGLSAWLDESLSVDALKIFKTAPQAYELVGRRYGVAPGEVCFQSSNRWDIAGAKKFGFRTNWINRQGAPDEYGDLAPDTILNSLEKLKQKIASPIRFGSGTLPVRVRFRQAGVAGSRRRGRPVRAWLSKIGRWPMWPWRATGTGEVCLDAVRRRSAILGPFRRASSPRPFCEDLDPQTDPQ